MKSQNWCLLFVCKPHSSLKQTIIPRQQQIVVVISWEAVVISILGITVTTCHNLSGKLQVYQLISYQVSMTCNEQQNRHIMKAQCSLRQGHFFARQCFHDEIHVLFFQRNYSFHDLSLRQAYLSICYTSCFQNHYSAFVINTLSSTRVATA